MWQPFASDPGVSWADRSHTILQAACRAFRRLMHAPCTVCGQQASGLELCPRCAALLAKTPWGITGLICADTRIPVLWRETYGGPLTETIYRSKYHGEWGAARLLGQCLGQLPRPWLGQNPILIPVPLTGRRLGDRGYNQSLVIARQAARLWRVQVQALWLTKSRSTARQASLAHGARADNLTASFSGSKKLHNQRVILIDDIMTSGATLREAERAVRACGGQVIAGAVIAHVPKPQRRIAARPFTNGHDQHRSG